MTTSSAIRRQLRQQRLSLTTQARYHASRMILRRIRQVPIFKRTSLRIGLYLDAFGEVPTAPLISALQQQGHQVWLPVTQRPPKPCLVWSRLTGPLLAQRLHRQRIGMHELRRLRHQQTRHLDVLLMPLVGFDPLGYRLGMGGGYYDRALANLPNRPVRIGLAYDFQHCSKLTVQPWDQRLHWAITPSRLWHFRQPL